MRGCVVVILSLCLCATVWGQTTPSATPAPTRQITPSHIPTPSATRTPFPSIARNYNQSGDITMVIDDFTAGTWQRVAWQTKDGNQQLTSNYEATMPCEEAIVGCSRSMKLQADANATDDVGGSATILPHVYYRVPGSCWFRPPNTNSSVLTLQYDGDNDPNSVNVHGLGGMDWTVNGRSKAIVYSVIAGYGAVRSIDFELYDIHGNQCVGSLPQQNEDCHHFVPQAFFLHQFVGNCDMKQIGAFQMHLVAVDSYDELALGRIQLVSFVDPNWLAGARC